MFEYDEICEEIELLEPVLEERLKKFDDEWFAGGSAYKFSYLDWETKREMVGGYMLRRINYLNKRKRQIMDYILEDDIPSYGNIMTLEHFIENVKSGMFIDYDGYGYYVKDGKKSNIIIVPSDVEAGTIRNDFDEIVWFNR